MEEIYANVEYNKPVVQILRTNQGGPSSSEKTLYVGGIITLGLLVIFLLAGISVLGLYSQNKAADFSTIKDNLTKLLQTSNDKLSSMTEERDLLKTSLNERAEELTKLQKLTQNKACPAGWRMFSPSCYLLSTTSDSWDEARADCRKRGADLVVIDSSAEQTFLNRFTDQRTWIGLTDREKEGSWKWVDGNPLTLQYWDKNEPNNGGRNPNYGDEDCAEKLGVGQWNDLKCAQQLNWICEKVST